MPAATDQSVQGIGGECGAGEGMDRVGRQREWGQGQIRTKKGAGSAASAESSLPSEA